MMLAACGGSTKTVTVTSSSRTASASTRTSTSSAPSTPTTLSTGSATPSTVVARTQSNLGVTIEVNTLKRTSANIVELDFTLVAGSNANGLGLADGGLGGRDVSGVTLVDEQAQKQYLTVQDSDGNCVCSNNLFADTPGYATNTTGHFYADITAPPPA